VKSNGDPKTMADFEKVYKINFDTNRAKKALDALDIAVERLDKASVKAEKAISSIAKPSNIAKWKSFGKTAQRSLDKIGDSATRLAKGLAKGLAISFGVAAGAATLLVREFSKIQDAEAAFTPLLGGAERAAEMVKKLNDTAATTPFQFQNLADSAKLLLPVMNGDIENTVRTLRMLGDTAGGNAQKFESITRGFTKAMLKGKADMESLNMIAEAGVPIFTELAASMGQKVGKQFFKDISAGKVSVEDISSAFRRMTSEGGIFFGGMEIASRTLSGRWSTLKDNISLTAASLGKSLAPTVERLLTSATKLTQRVRDWVDANKDLINTKIDSFIKVVGETIDEIVDAFRAWKGERDIVDIIGAGFRAIGNALVFIMRNWSVITKLTIAVGVLIGVIKALSVALTVVNALAALSPIGLIVLAVIAAIAAFTALIYWAEEVVAFFENLPKPIQFVIATLLPFIALIYLIAKAASIVKANWEPIVKWFEDIFADLPDLWGLAMGSIEEAFWRVIKALSDGFNYISRHVTSVINPIIEFFGSSPINFEIDTSSFESDIARLRGKNIEYSASLSNRDAVQHTESNISKYGQQDKPGYTDEWSLQSIPKQNTEVKFGDTNINIKTGSGDPRKIAEEVTKSLDRSFGTKFKQAASSIGASER